MNTFISIAYRVCHGPSASLAQVTSVRWFLRSLLALSECHVLWRCKLMLYRLVLFITVAYLGGADTLG